MINLVTARKSIDNVALLEVNAGMRVSAAEAFARDMFGSKRFVITRRTSVLITAFEIRFIDTSELFSRLPFGACADFPLQQI